MVRSTENDLNKNKRVLRKIDILRKVSNKKLAFYKTHTLFPNKYILLIETHKCKIQYSKCFISAKLEITLTRLCFNVVL